MSLELEHIHVSFRDGAETRHVLDDVSLSVEPGEVVAFTGASGSGKSTLIAVAALLQKPDRGTVTIAGHDASEASGADRTALRRDHIGVIYQSANLLPSLKAHEQVELMAHIDGKLDEKARRRARELLVAVGLSTVSTLGRESCREGSVSGWASPGR